MNNDEQKAYKAQVQFKVIDPMKAFDMFCWRIIDSEKLFSHVHLLVIHWMKVLFRCIFK